MSDSKKRLGPIGLLLSIFREDRIDPALVLVSMGGLIGLLMILYLLAVMAKLVLVG